MENSLPETPPENPSPVPASIFERILYGIAVIALPWLAFWGVDFLAPEWQTGEWKDYIALLISPQAALFFIGLIIYSVISLILLLLRPTHFATSLAIRLGVYTGVVLAFQYTILLALILPMSLIAGAGMVFAVWTTRVIGRKFGTRSALCYFFVLAALGLLAVSVWGTSGFSSIPFLLLAVLTGGSPTICFAIMLVAARQLWRKYDNPFRTPAFAAWLAGYTAAWAYSVYQMFQLYNALPKEPPPDCYIATAAAQGHPGFVGSKPVQTPRGTLWVNRQLQTLKCAELALLALAPQVHRPLRRLYDTLGRPFARRLSHPLLADLAYLSIKPAELLASALLRLLIPNLDQHIIRMYHEHL